ncbi:MAG TPA: glycerol kinase GlpK [Gemmatimonadetes bacterium]|nr:glycerol kinase GlpK [Gemmatimonadota bacterium]HIB09322.1 glycerol kinase GlpK [Gemmatimonadota bacterium]HIC16285.1 glycerol kinase GlpK [Gemmatimonadota bacterium]HIN78955.1 glycerol kinase [Gemmatimonadota bacterium]
MSVSSVLAIDQGTTGTTCLVIGQDGSILGRAYSEFTQHFPRPGWVEHDALEIWDTTVRVAREAIDTASGVDICAIGIANQRETIVLWDRETLEPVHPAIVWQDRRTSDICRELKNAGHENEVRARTGLVLDPYFSGTKIRWMLDQNPDLRSRAESGELAAGTVDSWLLARLTDGTVHATDPTNASRTLLFNLTEVAWDSWLLDLLGVPNKLLPEVRPSAGDFGVASGVHLGIEAPIAGIAGDQQAALFGQGCWSPGLAKNTYGTGAFLLLNTGTEVVPSTRGLLTTAACDERGGLAYALEGSVFIAGAAIQWLRDGLGLLEAAEQSEEMAASVEDNAGVYFVPAFVGLGAPHWVSDARGLLVGLTRGTKREHIVRAALEAMAYGTMDVLRTMEEEAALEIQELRVDGGAALNDWLIQFQADLLGIPLRRPGLVETTALGAAGLAGLATGVWSNADDFLSVQGSGTRCEPRMSEADRSTLKAEWDRAIRAAIQWAGDQ